MLDILPQSRRLGDMTIHYPETRHAEMQADFLAISPGEIGDFCEMQPGPVFNALYGSQQDWLEEDYEDPGAVLDEIADRIRAESISVRETVEGRRASWVRAGAEGTFDLFAAPVAGRLAAAVRGEELALILAVTPEDEWEEYEAIYEAMLERIEFN